MQIKQVRVHSIGFTDRAGIFGTVSFQIEDPQIPFPHEASIMVRLDASHGTGKTLEQVQATLLTEAGRLLAWAGHNLSA